MDSIVEKALCFNICYAVFMTILSLTSSPHAKSKLKGGSQRQNSHKDSVKMSNIGKAKQKLRHKAFSTILAIEEGTAWIDGKETKYRLRKEACLFGEPTIAMLVQLTRRRISEYSLVSQYS
jgi:hypothetical protein